MIALGLLALQFLHGQENRPITLNEAIELSVKNSKQLKVSQAKIEEATAALKEAVNNRLPDAKFSGSYLRLNSATVDLKVKNNNNNPGNVPKISQAMYGILNGSFAIYSGGRIRYGIEASKYLAEAAKLDADHDKEGVIENTIEAYVNLYKAKASVSLVKESLAEAQQRVKDFTNLEQNGLLPRNDLLKAELQTSNTELSLLDAENNWELANVSMNLLLGLPEKTQLDPDSALTSQTFSVKTLDEYVQSAYAHRNDLAAVDLRKKASQTGIKSAKSDYYPSIAVSGGYIAADIPKLITITNAVNLGAGVSYDLGSLWKTKARVQQAEAKAKQAELGESLLNDQVRLQVSEAYLNWLSSQKKIEVYTKAVDQANENYRVIKNRYNNSLSSTTDLLDADVAQLQARMNLEFGRADLVVVYNRLLRDGRSL